MERVINSFVRTDLDEKMVLLSGPRQVGKTTLSMQLFEPKHYQYFNYDRGEHREILLKKAWTRDTNLLIFDELHKMKKWKTWLKGIYDTEGNRPRMLITGSARLDTYKKGGDSLAGRFFAHRLHPLSVAELVKMIPPEESLETLLQVGGFPEPFFKGSEQAASRWRKSHLDRILREDLLDLESVREIKSIEILVDLLSRRVGGTVSYASLARDLEVSPHTVKKWILILESLFIVFVVTPYSKNISRAILKEPKIYFFDTGRVKGDLGARFENLVACALYKRKHFLEDTQGDHRNLFYVRDKEKREIDFLTMREDRPEWLIEAKLSNANPSSSLSYFEHYFPKTKRIQVVKTLERELQYHNIYVKNAASWLASLEA